MKLIDVKWLMVKEFYEDAYSMKIKRPDDLKIQDLYNNMKKISGNLGRFYETNPVLEQNYRRKRFLKTGAFKPTLSGSVDSSF